MLGSKRDAVADDLEADAVAVQLGDFAARARAANSSIRTDTSSAGRLQFSREREQRQVLDAALDAGLHRRAHRLDARLWPATRGRKRCFAQRPLPSMMMATWRGTSPCVGNRLGRAGDSRVIRPPSARLLFAASSLSISAMCRSVSFCTSSCARRSSSSDDLLLLEQLLQVLVGVAAQVAHGDPRVLGLVLHHLGQLLAALFGQRRHRHADQVALRRRVQAQVGLADRLLDRLAPSSSPRAARRWCARRAASRWRPG